MKRSGYKMKAGKEGPMKKNFPSVFKKDDKNSVEAQIAAAEAKYGEEGIKTPVVETERDRLAKKARRGNVNEGMEQSARSQSYKKADEYLAKKGDKSAADRLAKRKARTKKTKDAVAKNPNMTQAEVDKMMSER